MAAREEVISDYFIRLLSLSPCPSATKSNNTNEEDYHENKYHKGKR